MRELPMPEDLFGAPYLCMHRADLHSVELRFADGTRAQADAVIGAGGVHSVVRDIIIGPDMPIHGGRIAYRGVFSSALLKGLDIGRSRTKWWGPDRHIVIYYVSAARSEVYFVTSVPEPARITASSAIAKASKRIVIFISPRF
jgi:2-polyprenyl-6-methoxyphenol hydroxylase-like FAD-dependent oxidoreductase